MLHRSHFGSRYTLGQLGSCASCGQWQSCWPVRLTAAATKMATFADEYLGFHASPSSVVKNITLTACGRHYSVVGKRSPKLCPAGRGSIPSWSEWASGGAPAPKGQCRQLWLRPLQTHSQLRWAVRGTSDVARRGEPRPWCAQVKQEA